MARIKITLTDAAGNAITGYLVRLFNATGSSPSWGWGTSVGDFTEVGSTGEYYYDITTSGHYGIKAGVDAGSLAALTATLGMRVTAEDITTTYVLAVSSTDNNIPIFDGAAGQLQDSEKSFRTSSETTFADSDNAILTDKFIKNILASIANGKGASLIGIEDAAGNTAAANVEAALAELYGLLGNLNYDCSGTTMVLAVSHTAYHARITCNTVVDGDGDPVMGTYHFQFVFRNAAVLDPPNDITWETETTDITQAGTLLNITLPENGDVLYSGGTAGYCYLYVRCKFENLSYETAWDYESETISEPDDESAEALINELASYDGNGPKVIKALAGLIQDNSVIGRMMMAARQDYKSGAGTPTVTGTVPDYVGQWYFDSAAEDWYKAVDVANVSDFKKLT